MSQPEFGSVSPGGVYVRKQRPDVYTVLLIVSLVALLLGCLFLFLEIRAYGGFGAVRGTVAAVSAPLDASHPSAYERSPVLPSPVLFASRG